jgi:hypothetical protein
MSKVHDSNHFCLACEVMRNYFNKHGHTVATIRCDAGTIENSESVSQQLAEKFSIRIESASPECQYQNPCERGVVFKHWQKELVLCFVVKLFSATRHSERSSHNLSIIQINFEEKERRREFFHKSKSSFGCLLKFDKINFR